MDQDGDICAYKKKPTRMSTFWSRDNKYGMEPATIAEFSHTVGTLWLEANWFNSRIKIKNLKKLSGASLHEVVGVES